MAVEKIINLKVNDDIKDTENNVVSLKRQLREAQQDVQNLADKFGSTSREAVEAAKKAAELKDRIGDAKSLTDAYNPDAKFKALTGALSGAAGAGAAFAGTMGLVGVESKDVEQALLKVQSAMAISQGLQAVGESIDQFKILKTVIFGSTAAKTADTVATEANNASQSKNILGRGIQIVQTGIQTTLTAGLTAATWLFNAAMAANPIGAIVAVIALLIASGYALINMFMANSAAAKKNELANKALANEIKNNKKEQDKANETFQEARDHQLGMAKASGKSAEEIRKLTLQLAKQEVQQNATNYQTNRAIALEARRIASSEDATDAEKKTAAEATKLSNESTKALEQSVKNRRKVESENEIARKQEQTDAYKDSQEKQKKAGEDAVNTSKENAKKLAEEKKKQDQEEKDALTKKYRDAEAKADDFYAAEQKAKENNLKATMSAQAVELQTLRDSYAEKLKYAKDNGLSSIQLQEELTRKENEIKLKFQKEAIAKEDEQWLRLQELTLEKSEFDALVRQQKFEKEYTAAEGNAELQFELKKQYTEKETEIDNGKSAADIEREKNKNEAIGNFKQNLSNLSSNLEASGLAKSKTGQAIAKTIALTQMSIDTAVAISKASTLANAEGAAAQLAFPMVPGAGTIARVVSYASTAMQVYANFAKAKALLSGGGGGGAASGGGGGAAPAPPSFNIVGQNSNNQLAQTIAGQQQQPVQAYVVSGNVSSAQSLDRNRIDTATFN
jgi:hypothetical protein